MSFIHRKPLLETAAFQNLQTFYETQVLEINIEKEFESMENRFEKFSLHIPTPVDGTILIDYSKNRINTKVWDELLDLAKEQKITEAISALFSVENSYFSTNNPILYFALRNLTENPIILKDPENSDNDVLLMSSIFETLDLMKTFCNDVTSGNWKGYTCKSITDVVNISNSTLGLGPEMVTEALKSYSNGINCHYVTKMDETQLKDILRNLNPETTLFVIVSQNFDEKYVISHAMVAKKWFLEKTKDCEALSSHFIGVTNNDDMANEIGVNKLFQFQIFDWINERFSLWSTPGISIGLAIGFNQFEHLLYGAQHMDNHFKSSQTKDNAPVILALIGIWYLNFFNSGTHAIIPYAETMRKFPSYIQQLDMHSNGKYVTNESENVGYNTAPVVWGECGTDCQYSFFQALNQGTRLVPCDFIGFAKTKEPISNGHHQKILISNFIGQTKALMHERAQHNIIIDLATQIEFTELMSGKQPLAVKEELLKEAEQIAQEDEQGCETLLAKIKQIEAIEYLAQHKVLSGNRPSTSIVCRQLTPFCLGALIAMYEHKIFIQGIIWNINSFDNYGLELSTELSNLIEMELTNPGKILSHDSSTNGLMNFIKSQNETKRC